MRPLDVMVLSSRQLRERRLRSILTFLAIAVGVATVIALSAQVEGVKVSILENLGKLGPDVVIVSVRGRTPFTDADVARLKELEGVSKVTPILMTGAQVSGLKDQVSLIGVSAVDFVGFLGEVRLVDGNMYYDAPAPQALVGYNVAVDETGQSRYKVGQPILVQLGQRSIILNVVGVLDVYGTMPMVQVERSVFIPIEYVKTLLRGTGYTILVVKAQSTGQVDTAAELIGYVFGGRANVMTIKQVTEMVNTITSQINLLLLAIAGTSFIAAGLGTFNIMMISVLERVREIGILKALGMKDRGVLLVYVSQGLLIGLIGSAMGLGLGTALAYALPAIVRGFGAGTAQSQQMGMGQTQQLGMGSYTPVISMMYMGVAMSLSMLVTLVSSAYPAWKASRLSPVEALRYE